MAEMEPCSGLLLRARPVEDRSLDRDRGCPSPSGLGNGMRLAGLYMFKSMVRRACFVGIRRMRWNGEYRQT
jgi:hypothetical protein